MNYSSCRGIDRGATTVLKTRARFQCCSSMIVERGWKTGQRPSLFRHGENQFSYFRQNFTQHQPIRSITASSFISPERVHDLHLSTLSARTFDRAHTCRVLIVCSGHTRNIPRRACAPRRHNGCAECSMCPIAKREFEQCIQGEFDVVNPFRGQHICTVRRFCG